MQVIEVGGVRGGGWVISTSVHCTILDSSYRCSSIGTYSEISDEQLDQLVTAAQSTNPNIGIRMLKGLLHSKGHRVQRERIRQSLLRTDPMGVIQRWKEAARRRHYNVQSPLALWHIDGNHKLIRLRHYAVYQTKLFLLLSTDFM